MKSFFAITLLVATGVLALLDDTAFPGPIERSESLDLVDHSLFKRDGIPTFHTFGDVVRFAESQPKSASGGAASWLPGPTVRKCSDANVPDACVSCSIGSNIYLAGALSVCAAKYGPVTYAAPLSGTPLLAACVAAGVGIYANQLTSCLSK